MEKYLDVIRTSTLFRGIEQGDIGNMLQCLGITKKSYPKGSFVFYAGDAITSVGLLLKGSAHIVQEDYWGNRNILSRVAPGDIFGEAYACVPGATAEVSVAVLTDAEIMFMDIKKTLHVCPNTCHFHEQLASNLLAVVAQKSLFLTKKIQYLSQRTTRQKLMAYLSGEARRHGAPDFTIDFNRQQLADFLSVDRSAMSSELGKMRTEGMLDFDRQHFVLKT